MPIKHLSHHAKAKLKGRRGSLRHYNFSKANLAVVTLVVAGIGGYILFTSLAATSPVGDSNNDGQVNSADLTLLISKYATTNAATDFNQDGTTNILDLSILLSHFGRTVSGSTCQSVAIPAYSYPNPTTFWDAGIAAHPPVSIMIADPANGPGAAADSNYVATIARAKAAGIKVLGYVDTNYAAVSATTVNTNIDTWKTMYGISDIFFDETSSGAADLAYYQGIANHVHATSGAIVMFNPGVGTVEGYMAMADILNIFEGSQTDYSSFSMPSWTANYPASRFSHLIYAVPDAANMSSVLATSVSRHAGYVYITSDTLPNPWDQLPPYWTTEAAQINAACSS